MPPFYPSGIRIGTPAATTRGMKEKDMTKIAIWINKVIEEVKNERLPDNKEKRAEFMRGLRQRIAKNKNLLGVAKEVLALTKRFPLP